MVLKLLMVLFLVSCGKNNDCPSCPSNPPNEPAPPPKPPENPPPPPVEPSDKKINCYLKWELEGEPEGRHFVVFYSIVNKANKEVFASLRSEYHAGEEIVEGSEASKLYAAGEKNSAEVSTFVWQASLKEMTATIKNNPLNESREVLCE